MVNYLHAAINDDCQYVEQYAHQQLNRGDGIDLSYSFAVFDSCKEIDEAINVEGQKHNAENACNHPNDAGCYQPRESREQRTSQYIDAV